MASNKKHPFHLVDPSPWPFVTSMVLLVLCIGGVLYMHDIDKVLFYLGLVGLFASAAGWWWDVIKESRVQGLHTEKVQMGLKIGMVLFIASEVMFFVAFFWSYFNASLFPTEATGGVWPPKGIQTFDPFHLPYFNTLLLLLSGTTVTWAHHALLNNNQKEAAKALLATVVLGMIFTCVQGIEYAHATFGLGDGVYPSNFFLATGFHGFHVIVGTIFLAVCYFRMKQPGDFTVKHHVGFESAAWYWHFVDVVWLFLFVAVYWWGAGEIH